MGDLRDEPAGEILLDYPSRTETTRRGDLELAAACRRYRTRAGTLRGNNKMTGRVREWCERVLGLMRRWQPDRDLEAEIAAHIDMAVKDNLRSGMGAEEARRVAMIRFGSRDCAKEEVRDQRGLRLLESFFKDVRYALRSMHRSTGFTAVVVLTLALGTGRSRSITASTRLKIAVFAIHN